jgi:hypothetical protein
MKPHSHLVVVLATVLVALSWPVGSASAQDPDWTKVPRKPKQTQTKQTLGRRGTETSKFIALEFGHPRVLSPRLSFPWGERQRVGVAITLLPDLTAWGIDYRYSLNRDTIERLHFLAGVGLTAYSIEDGNRSASPVGVNMSLGAIYRTASRFGLGGNLGILQTTGSKGTDPVKAYGVHKGLSTAYVSFAVGYFF